VGPQDVVAALLAGVSELDERMPEPVERVR
jgi:hypothetical protein